MHELLFGGIIIRFRKNSNGLVNLASLFSYGESRNSGADQKVRSLWDDQNVARTDFLSVRRVFVSYSQPVRFVRFDGSP